MDITLEPHYDIRVSPLNGQEVRKYFNQDKVLIDGQWIGIVPSVIGGTLFLTRGPVSEAAQAAILEALAVRDAKMEAGATPDEWCDSEVTADVGEIAKNQDRRVAVPPPIDDGKPKKKRGRK